MNEQWQELKETIIEMRDNNGTATQQEVCKFLANLMEVLEKQMQEPKTGHWIGIEYDAYGDGNPVYDVYECSECGGEHHGEKGTLTEYCPNCGAKMEE